MKYILFLLVGMMVFNGCSSDVEMTNPDKGLYFCNFEDQLVWNENSRLFYNRGREGSACTKVDMSNEYSETFRLPVKYLKMKNPKKISVEAWTKVSDLKSKAVLVTSIKVGSHDIVWNGIDTDTRIIKPDVWTKLDVSIDLPPTIDTSAIIMVYGFRKSDGEILFDDIKIKIE